MRRSPRVFGLRGVPCPPTPALVSPHPQCDREALATRRRSAASPQLTRMRARCRTQVKVNNQYTLQEGERSVFDEELGDIIKTNSRQYDKPLPKKTAAPRQARCYKLPLSLHCPASPRPPNPRTLARVCDGTETTNIHPPHSPARHGASSEGACNARSPGASLREHPTHQLSLPTDSTMLPFLQSHRRSHHTRACEHEAQCLSLGLPRSPSALTWRLLPS